MMQWAFENGCPWDSNLFSLAANLGKMEVLYCLHDNLCPWDVTALKRREKPHVIGRREAYQNFGPGSLGSLQWLCRYKCPWQQQQNT